MFPRGVSFGVLIHAARKRGRQIASTRVVVKVVGCQILHLEQRTSYAMYSHHMTGKNNGAAYLTTVRATVLVYPRALQQAGEKKMTQRVSPDLRCRNARFELSAVRVDHLFILNVILQLSLQGDADISVARVCNYRCHFLKDAAQMSFAFIHFVACLMAVKFCMIVRIKKKSRNEERYRKHVNKKEKLRKLSGCKRAGVS